MHHLILNSFIFKPVETSWLRYGLYVGAAGGALYFLKCMWDGIKWMGEAYYKWRKNKDKDLQRELEEAREAQNRIDTIDQIQARPPARQRSRTRR